jgi:hypothetical protein
MLVIVRNELRTLRMGNDRFYLSVRTHRDSKWKRAGGKAQVTKQGLRHLGSRSITLLSRKKDAILKVPEDQWSSLEGLLRDPNRASIYFEYSPYREVMEELVQGDNCPKVMRERDVNALVFSFTDVRFKSGSHFGQSARVVTWCFEGLFPGEAALSYFNTELFEQCMKRGQLRVSTIKGRSLSAQELLQGLQSMH